ncbi:MAG: flavin reductase family protein, partial [Pseudomonadota bacterium]
ISVKQEGLVSSHLHQKVGVGTLLHARSPVGAFVLEPSSRRPLVLLAAGVGITPLLAMLREALAQQARGEPARHLYLFQSARRLADLAFREELDELVRRGAGYVHVQRLLSQPESEAVPGSQFDQAGRLSIEHLKRALPFDDYDFYLCGPGGFTQALYDGLRALRIADDRLHAETFGPSTLRRSAPVQDNAPAQPPAATAPVAVVFSRSAKEARWTPPGGSLLELAESRGLNPEFSCRGGSCGTCSTRILSGAVHYPNPPAELPEADHALICCAVPAEQGDNPTPLVLDL